MRVGKTSSTFDSLLIYWKTKVIKNNLINTVVNLSFQIPVYHSITSNNYNYVVSPVLLLYSDTPGVILEEEKPYITHFPPVIIN